MVGKKSSWSGVVVIATLLLVAAPMFLLLHSGRPLRAWHLFVYLNGTSPISWGSFLLTIYPINCVIYGYFMFKGNAKLTKIFGRIGIPLALMVHGYTGFILSFAKAHVLWRSSMMPILFLTSALVSGVAMMILVTIVKDKFFSESGEVTLFAPSASSQTVRIESESLPTGTAMPNAGQSSSPTARTASKRPASSPGCPAAAIQLHESLT